MPVCDIPSMRRLKFVSQSMLVITHSASICNTRQHRAHAPRTITSAITGPRRSTYKQKKPRGPRLRVHRIVIPPMCHLSSLPNVSMNIGSIGVRIKSLVISAGSLPTFSLHRHSHSRPNLVEFSSSVESQFFWVITQR